MDEQMKRTIYKTMSEVFETMFFTFIEPLPSIPREREWGSNKTYIKAKIAYSGAMTGGVTLYVPSALARFITVSMLGVGEGDIEDRQLLDAMRETVNMSVGSLLGKVDPEGKCSLGIPEATIVDDFTPANLVKEPGICPFNTEFGLLWVLYKS